jgi:hypothetical protein
MPQSYCETRTKNGQYSEQQLPYQMPQSYCETQTKNGQSQHKTIWILWEL